MVTKSHFSLTKEEFHAASLQRGWSFYLVSYPVREHQKFEHHKHGFLLTAMVTRPPSRDNSYHSTVEILYGGDEDLIPMINLG